jgi:reactive intermediate/imine deaminase
MTKEIIQTTSAPEAIGTYSQAVKTGNTIYLSGQIALDPQSMKLVEGIEAQIHQVFKNLKSVVEASDAQLSDIVKINIYLTDLSHFSLVNTIMGEYFTKPYPARAAVGVASLPRNALIEADGVVVI